MDIIVGSKSPIKLGAVERACRILDWEVTVMGVETGSGQNEQPEGLHETYFGAYARATNAGANNPEAVAIGIESGIVPMGPEVVDVAVVVVIPPHGNLIINTSIGLPVPKRFVEIAAARGFETTTVGAIVAEQLGGDPADPHDTLTAGEITREMLLTDVLVAALRQLSF